MCDKCKDYCGRWMMTPSGLKRCSCLPAIVPIASRPPVLTEEQCTVFVEMLAAIPFFPSEGGARIAIGEELRSLCAGPVEALWLATRMGRLYRRWPGISELRRVYASKHVPHDGEMPIGISEHYPDGIPSEKDSRPMLVAPERKRLAAGESDDAEMEAEIQQVSAAKAMPSAPVPDTRFSRELGRCVTAPCDREPLPAPTPQIVTQADIDRAVEEVRRKKAETVNN